MAVTLRSIKGSALTHAEMDANFQSIDDKSSGVSPITPDINGGTIDNAVIGETTPNSGTFTYLTASQPTVVSVNSTSAAIMVTQTGSGNALVIEDSTNPDATPFVIDTSGRAIVGGTAVITPLTAVTPQLQVQGTSAATSSILSSRFSNDVNASSYIFTKSRNTSIGFGGAVASGDILGNLQWVGDDGASGLLAAQIRAEVDGTPGTNDMPGRLMFSTTADGASTTTERLRIDSFGNILNKSTGGLGYGTGSGGAVTQLTSRTTGVTINKTNGAITLVSAAGSTSWQTFTVTNSTVAATDVVIVNQKSGTDLNEIHVTAVAAGSFNITFRTTGGTTTEQPVFNFAVIKAVTS